MIPVFGSIVRPAGSPEAEYTARGPRRIGLQGELNAVAVAIVLIGGRDDRGAGNIPFELRLHRIEAVVGIDRYEIWRMGGASLAIVPEMNPVDGSKAIPGGNPVTVNWTEEPELLVAVSGGRLTASPSELLNK